MRIGMGYDVHRLAPERALILGGVRIEYELGLLGHSDADVLCHALMDALLGAAGLPDIGRFFPDNDPAYAGADSLELLRQVGERVRQAGFAIGNLDGVIVAERPKLAPYIDQMRGNIAGVLGLAAGAVGLKATTTEGLGFAGAGEGIAVYAIALLE